jgi:hypothetical protein
VRQNTYIQTYLQSASEGVVGLTMLNPPIASDYNIGLSLIMYNPAIVRVYY